MESTKSSAECAVYTWPAEKGLPIRSMPQFESVLENLANQPLGQANLVDLRVEWARLLSSGRGRRCLYPETRVPSSNSAYPRWLVLQTLAPCRQHRRSPPAYSAECMRRGKAGNEYNLFCAWTEQLFEISPKSLNPVQSSSFGHDKF